jgi:uncharacterized protein involved in copper resistance
MRRVALVLALAMLPAAPALAKKKPPKTSAQTSQKDADKAPPPNDKRTNEGAQGRMNATEDAAKDADSPQFQHRP